MTRTTDTRAAGALRNGFRGRVITPPDADDDKARTLWNGAIDKRAALIARCADATDVAAALRAPLDTGLPIAVRGGGHGVAGTSSADDGLVIDLSPMRRRAWVPRFWEALRPHSTGVYVTFLGDEDPDRVRAAYGETTCAQAARMKARHDPDNVFRLNQNIEPAPADGRTHGGRP